MILVWFRDGLALFRVLPGTADRAVLLCTDLHAGNLLAARREPWLVIDPKPYVGDPTYDVLQHLLNWLFARCVPESPDSPALAEVARLIETT